MRPEITVIRRLNTPHQNEQCDSFISGLESLGIPYVYNKNQNSVIKTKRVAAWGWRMQHLLPKHDILCLEHGYIGDRRKYTSLGWNGLNNYATFAEYPDDNGARFKRHGGILKPWKNGGEYILILGQVKGDSSLKGQDIAPWYQRMAKEAHDHYGLPVYFRPHPVSQRRKGYESIRGLNNLGGTLDEAIAGALFTIAYNSNSCLDSVMQGVPCYAGDRGTMAWDLCMKEIAPIVYPKREDVVSRVAWTQFDLEEIAAGWPLKRLLK